MEIYRWPGCDLVLALAENIISYLNTAQKEDIVSAVEIAWKASLYFLHLLVVNMIA